MTSTLTFKTGEKLEIKYAPALDMFITPIGKMTPTVFHKWLKGFAITRCTHEDTLKSNAGYELHRQYKGITFKKTNYKLCQNCKTKLI